MPPGRIRPICDAEWTVKDKVNRTAEHSRSIGSAPPSGATATLSVWNSSFSRMGLRATRTISSSSTIGIQRGMARHFITENLSRNKRLGKKRTQKQVRPPGETQNRKEGPRPKSSLPVQRVASPEDQVRHAEEFLHGPQRGPPAQMNDGGASVVRRSDGFLGFGGRPPP